MSSSRVIPVSVAAFKKWGSMALLTLALSIPTIASALSGNHNTGMQGTVAIEQTVDFAKRVEKSLAAHRAQIAFVARAGRPASELPRGVHYTHVGLAVYSRITTEDGRTIPGYATYNLYQKQNPSNQSELVQDYMLDFFTGVTDLRAGILIPNEKLQQKLLGLIADGSFKELHNERYSLISNPYNNVYQNCNEYLLNLIQSAIYNTTDMTLIKQSIAQYFDAFSLPVNPLAVIIGGMFRREVAVHDHPERFETVTFGSLVDFLERYDLSTANYTLTAHE